MGTPYWGSLEPLVKISRRGSVRRSAEIPKDERAPRSNRMSDSTMDSNSIVSPTGSNFHPDALAPPPPSFTHGDVQSKEWRPRPSLESERSPAIRHPPAVPDAPRAPPLSCKAPSSEWPIASRIPARSRSTRRTNEPIVGRGNKEASVGSKDIQPSDHAMDKEATTKDTLQGKPFARNPSKSFRSELPKAHRSGPDQRQHPARSQLTETALSPADGREAWAPSLSPLQRLELVLEGLTKEEKRARAEEAELLAQIIPKRTTSLPHGANRPAAISGYKETTPKPAREAAGKQKAGLQQVRQGEQLIPRRGNSLRDRDAFVPSKGALASTDSSMARSLSKRLRQERPGDPWYSQRKDGESNHRDVKLKKSDDSLESSSDDQTDDLSPTRKGPSRIIEQLTGMRSRLPGRSEPGKRLKGYEFANTERSSLEKSRGADSRHHLSDFIPGHHARVGYRPGKGLYLPPQPLKDWKQGSTGFLSAAYTDLDAKQTELEKNKAIWEAEDSGNFRSHAFKPRRNRNNGGRENSGTVFSDFSIGGDGPVVNQNSVKEKQKKRDAVVSEDVVCEGTSATSERLQKNDPSDRPFAKIESQTSDTEGSWNHISPYSSKGPRPYEHNTLYPFHLCPSKASSQLTASTRCIRVRPITAPANFQPALYLKCGPLLRYTGMRREPETSPTALRKGVTEREIWRGSVLIATTDEYSDYLTPPVLRLFSQPVDLPPPPPSQIDGTELPSEYVDPIAGLYKIARDGSTLYVRPVEDLDFGKDLSNIETEDGLFETQKSPTSRKPGFDGTKDPKVSTRRSKRRDGEKIGKYLDVPAIRLDVQQGVTFWKFNIEVALASHSQRIAYRINKSAPTGFWVPARGEAMNIMFYSCNGFTDTVDPNPYGGPDPLWRDVLNSHQMRPFHCMIGGGDQIYNDAVMTETELFKDWVALKSPVIKHNAPCTAEMQLELETFYLNRYCMWFSQGLFGLAASQIPTVNIYDDHDIIDGFGSYPDSFMQSPVFQGLGAIAYRYYLLFQHHTITDEGEESEPSWIIGPRPGPWMGEHSRSLYLSLGKSIAFVGLDCRTERRRDEIVGRETYEKVFARCRREIRSGETKHLIFLLGVPIAYPRLFWLENLLTSRLLDPIRAAGRMGLFKDFINDFDGGVETLDDLDDHWCAKNHKDERAWLVEALQELAKEFSIRITILGGDVHLGAIGRFYSNPALRIPKDRDHRYMPNIISSAIVNEPPPELMADMLNKRSKVHHLNRDTDESMVPIFTHDVDDKPRNNKCLLPRRNWCSINLYVPETSPPQTPPSALDGSDTRTPSPQLRGRFRRRRDPKGPSYTPDGAGRAANRRQPISASGIMRQFSTVRRRKSIDDSEHANGLRRTLSLSRKDFTPSLFRRCSSKRTKPDDGGINGYGAESEDSPPDDSQLSLANSSSHSSARARGRGKHVASDSDIHSLYFKHKQGVHQRGGGAAGRDDQSSLAFRRTPADQARRGGGASSSSQQSINLEGGLEITLNVEREQGDPAGITVPYQFIVPALWFDEQRDGAKRRPSALERFRSLKKGRERERERGQQEQQQREDWWG